MHLFAYGTLMCPEIITRVIGYLPAHQPARLAHYRRGPLSKIDYPAIVPQEHACVSGFLYLDLTSEDWDSLDEFEDEIYYRCPVTVSLTDGHSLAAETYVLRPEYTGRLGDAAWSYAEFLKAGRGRFEKEYSGFPKPVTD